MSWEALGALAELGGAVSVVITLFFLAGQLRINSRELERNNAYQRVAAATTGNQTYISVWQPLMQDSELAGIYLKGTKGKPLTEIEELRFRTFVNTSFAFLELSMIQIKQGVGFEDYDDGVHALFLQANRYLSKLIDNPAGKRWLEEDAVCLFTDEFMRAFYEYGPLK
tara:strand:- start:1063 stop:1566 length:504 start_codon:yes stop_codon:yes gene_type:complete